MPTQNGRLQRDDNDYPVMGGTSTTDNKTIINSNFDPITRRLLTSSSGGSSSITVTDGITTVTGVTTLDFTSGATVTNPGGGQANVAITGSGGTPGGLNTQIQYNNAGSFGGITGAVTDGTAVSLTAPHLLNPTINGAGAGLATLTYPNTATSVSIAFPATSGTVALTSQLTTGTVTNVSSADTNATVATQTTTPVITIVAAPKLATARTIGTVTGDATSAGSTFDGSANNTNALTLATVNATTGSFGSATAAPSITVNGKGLVTNVSLNTITPAVGSITGLGTGVGTWLATPSSANLAAAITDETGSGALVFGTSPTLATAILGSSTATTQSPSDNSTKVATTAYVDNAILGQNFKEAALVATTANLVGVYVSGVFTYTATGTDTIDGVTLALGNRVLVKNQTTTFQNGIYSVTTAGTIGVAGVLTRSSDANTSGEFKTGDALFVTSGTVNASTTWAYTGVDSPTLGTDAITYAQVAGLGTYVAGNGLTLTGNSFSIDTSITVDKTTAQTLTNKSIVATQLTGTLQAGQFPALTGDITTSAGALATTLATVNSNVGSFTNASITVNGKGLITAASNGTAPVISVAGTTNRITVTGTTSAVVDIAATYVGQSSITTLGTITTGVWTGTTIAVANGGTGVTSVTTTPAATAFAGWDANKNLSANNLLEGYTTVSAATGTTTLTIASTQIQSYTGTTSQTYVLPTTSIVAGTQYEIQNNSNGVVTVQASNTATIIILGISASATFTALVATPTTVGNWNVNVKNVTAASGKFGSFSNTIAFTGTDNTSFAFPSTNATIARTDAAQTFTGVQTLSSAPVLSTGTVTVSGTTQTFPTTATTLAGLAITQSFTATQTGTLWNTTPQALSVTTNAATADINHGIQNFTNSSAAAMTITLTTTSAVDGQFKEIRIYDASAVAEGITWVNTENSTVTVPTTSNGSTTLPLSVLFQYNGSTSKWRCLASS